MNLKSLQLEVFYSDAGRYRWLWCAAVCAGVGEKLTGNQSLVDRWRSSVAATHARSAAKRFRRTYGIHKRGAWTSLPDIFAHNIGR